MSTVLRWVGMRLWDLAVLNPDPQASAETALVAMAVLCWCDRNCFAAVEPGGFPPGGFPVER